MTMANSSFTVVQITDTHYFADSNGTLFDVNTAASLDRVIASINASRVEPEFILATGDLVHDEGAPAYERLARDLDALSAPIYGLAGNHDMAGAVSGRYNGRLTFPFRVQHRAWQFFLLNTQIDGEVGGRLSAQQLGDLNKALAAHPGQHTIVCLHHQPVKIGSHWLDGIGLENPNELFTVIGRFTNVRAVIWGHIHQEWDEIRAGVRLLGSPSTCAQFLPKQENFALDTKPPGWRWLRLFDDGTLETEVVWVD